MILADMIFVVLFALLFSCALTWGLHWRHPMAGGASAASFLFLLLVLFLTMWGWGAWMVPWGPVAYGSAWLSILVTGLVVSLLVLAIAAPATGTRSNDQARSEREVFTTGEHGVPEARTATAAAFGLFFWLLLMVLLISIILRSVAA